MVDCSLSQVRQNLMEAAEEAAEAAVRYKGLNPVDIQLSVANSDMICTLNLRVRCSYRPAEYTF